MLKKLILIGNDYGILIEKPIAELLNIDTDTDLEVTTNGIELIIRPINKDHSRRVMIAARNVLEKHYETLNRLAQ